MLHGITAATSALVLAALLASLIRTLALRFGWAGVRRRAPPRASAASPSRSPPSAWPARAAARRRRSIGRGVGACSARPARSRCSAWSATCDRWADGSGSAPEAAAATASSHWPACRGRGRPRGAVDRLRRRRLPTPGRLRRRDGRGRRRHRARPRGLRHRRPPRTRLPERVAAALTAPAAAGARPASTSATAAPCSPVACSPFLRAVAVQAPRPPAAPQLSRAHHHPHRRPAGPGVPAPGGPPAAARRQRPHRPPACAAWLATHSWPFVLGLASLAATLVRLQVHDRRIAPVHVLPLGLLVPSTWCSTTTHQRPGLTAPRTPRPSPRGSTASVDMAGGRG